MRSSPRLLCFLLALLLSAHAAAVPVPWKNCGKAGDQLFISKNDVSVWPPSVAAPVNATATFDTSGNLLNLRMFLVHGFAWTFDSGPLATTQSAGFVSLPASFPVTLASPPLPLPAGPVVTTHVFGAKSATPVTVAQNAILGSDLNLPVTTTASLSFEGTPGFPLNPNGGAYGVHVQMAESDGMGVFCMDITVPLKSGGLVDVITPTEVPSLSRVGLALVALLIGVCAALGIRRGSRDPRRIFAL